MPPLLELTDHPGPRMWQEITTGLTAFNEAHAGPEEFRFLIVALRERAGGDVLGGLWGRTLFRWLYVNILFVPQRWRGQGVGTKLMHMAEREAVARGCGGALVDTFSFQARPFYEKLGYGVFGTVEGYPPGHACFFLQKTLP